jgi:hypothetical protein
MLNQTVVIFLQSAIYHLVTNILDSAWLIVMGLKYNAQKSKQLC